MKNPELIKLPVIDHISQVDISTLSGGVYFVKITEKKTVKVEKLVKQ